MCRPTRRRKAREGRPAAGSEKRTDAIEAAQRAVRARQADDTAGEIIVGQNRLGYYQIREAKTKAYAARRAIKQKAITMAKKECPV